MSTKKLSLEKLEEDIRLCEQYLAQEKNLFVSNESQDDVEQTKLPEINEDHAAKWQEETPPEPQHDLKRLLSKLKESDVHESEDGLGSDDVESGLEERRFDTGVYNDDDDDDDGDAEEKVQMTLFDASTGQPYNEADGIGAAVVNVDNLQRDKNRERRMNYDDLRELQTLPEHAIGVEDADADDNTEEEDDDDDEDDDDIKVDMKLPEPEPSARTRRGAPSMRETRLNNYTIPIEFSLSHRRPPSRAPTSDQPSQDTKPKFSKRLSSKINQWTYERTRKIERWEKARAQKENSELANCTFHPSLPASSIRRRRRQISDESRESVPDRLMRRADDKVVQRERMRRERQREEEEALSFAPTLSARSRSLASRRAARTENDARPLHERVGDIQRRREALRRVYEGEAEASFRPMISKRSVELARQRKQHQQRDGGGDSVLRQIEKQHKLEQSVHDQCTFRPRLNENSAELYKRSELPDDFVERQTLLEQRANEQRHHLQNDAHKRTTPSFRPQFNGRRRRRTTTMTTANEDIDERVHRLSYEDSVKRKIAQEHAEMSFYDSFEFRPKINARSRRMATRANTDAAATDAVERLSGHESAVRAKQKVLDTLEREFRRSCSFKPKLSRKGEKSAGLLGFRDDDNRARNIERYQSSKTARLESARRMMVEKKQQESSYRPFKAAVVKEPNGPVVVRGLGRFLELKKLSERLKEEQLEREDIAFGRRPRRQRTGVMTVPKPFKLSSSTEQWIDSVKRIKDEAQQEERRHCTFQPDTIARRNRDMILQILQDDDDDDDDG